MDHAGTPVKARDTPRFRYLLDPLFLVGCTAYALNRWLIKPQVGVEFIYYQFNDLWVIPCALPPVLWLHRVLGLGPHKPCPPAGKSSSISCSGPSSANTSAPGSCPTAGVTGGTCWPIVLARSSPVCGGTVTDGSRGGSGLPSHEF
ncbi:hypothetical protein [Verrucomicrobium spinosum]|uniref:hypothetical protein n=1 Tax=Verrucomicrobium spinosum TaxID=2736 RepID=UPI0012E1A7D3|nr:hypothetical protein [Verrucomicrobium spinosum]